MVRNLLVLNSSTIGSRDIWYPKDPKATKGYNIYRATDAPYHWVKLNQTGPVPGQFYRDQSQLLQVRYEVQPQDWVSTGGGDVSSPAFGIGGYGTSPFGSNPRQATGQYCFKIPDTPFSAVVQGRPIVSSSVDDVQVQVTYNDDTTGTYRPGLVSGIDQTIFLPVGSGLPQGGAVTVLPIIDFVNAVKFVCIYNKLINYVDIQANLLRTYYCVVPVGDHGEEHEPGASGTEIADTQQVDRMDYMQREMVRRNAWLFEQVGEPAYLMFRRRAGERCGCTTTETGTPRTRCPICFEVGVVGGYYGPYDFLFIDPDQAAVRTLNEGGIKVERPSRSFLGPTPIVQDGDMVIRRNGERLVISGVTYKMPRGVMLQQDFDVELLSPGDTRYLIPLANPAQPIIFNPASQHDPLDGKGGAEPIYQTSTMPHKHWEGEPQVGRTITWGNIQS